MRVLLLCCGGSTGGGLSYTNYLLKALIKVGVIASIVTPSTIGEPDLLLLTSIGMTGEKNIKANEKRLEKIEKYYGKIPFALVRHGVTELTTFKHSYSYFKDKIFDLVVSVELSSDMHDHIADTMRLRSLVYIGHPFEFNDENFEDKSLYKDTIVSSPRMASCKHTNMVLDLAAELWEKRKFLVAGDEKGIYWYYAIREHKHRNFVEFIGAYNDYKEIYKTAAFGMDLSYIQRGKYINKNRTQYTVLEAVDCGCIPIGFDVWYSENGYEGIWFPSPRKVGRSMVFEVEDYAEIVLAYEYNFEIAKRNREVLKEKCDLGKIGELFKYHLERFVK